MKNTNNLLLLLICSSFFFACTNDAAKELTTTNNDQESIKALIENSEAYNAIKPALEELNKIEASELSELKSNQTPINALPEDEPFVFFVIGDSELGMRGNTYPQLLALIEGINNIESSNLEFIEGDFEEGESRTITKPELVLLAGDICGDRTFGFSLPGDDNAITNQETNQLFNQFDEDILFFPGNGNHDWDPYEWSDNSWGHNLGGLLSNLGTASFVRSRYNRALNNTTEESGASYNYDRNVTWWPAISSAEFNYSFVYKGLRFTQLNQFLQQPVAMVSDKSLFNTGPARYYKNRTSQWFQGLCDESAATSSPHVVIQHFPVNTGDGWWNDDLGGTPNELRKEFLDIFEDSHEATMFTGHNHSRRKSNIEPYGIVDYTAGYFAQGYVIAVKASTSKGVYAVTHINLSTLATSSGDIFSSTYNVPQ